MQTAQAWLVTGANGSGKAEFLKMLAGQEQIIPNCADLTEKTENGIFFNFFKDSAEIVSLERAASLIEEVTNIVKEEDRRNITVDDLAF